MGRYNRDLESGKTEKGAGCQEATNKPKLNKRNTFIKWFVDSICLGAVFNTVMFLALMGAMKGESLDLIKRNLENVSVLYRPVHGKALCGLR